MVPRSPHRSHSNISLRGWWVPLMALLLWKSWRVWSLALRHWWAVGSCRGSNSPRLPDTFEVWEKRSAGSLTADSLWSRSKTLTATHTSEAPEHLLLIKHIIITGSDKALTLLHCTFQYSHISPWVIWQFSHSGDAWRPARPQES